ncbi:MAG: methionine biosynthesis protein MetW [Candidatus Omnitrophica bacterium]|nr:methionine biosynthesis protein MetW [Candidatus Omnitrophota bacterium]
MSINIDPKTRLDYRVIVDLIEHGSKVLDLGCGDGELLSLLIRYKSCKGTGIEIDEKAIYACIAKGLTVSHGDIDSGLNEYADKRFDYVILNESLQQMLNPQTAILEALRVGKKVVVGIPNFCHIQARIQIFFRGRVPVTKELPYEWYDTPNLRFFSLKDFKIFCKANSIKICNERAIDTVKEVSTFPNLFAHIGIFVLEK